MAEIPTRAQNSPTVPQRAIVTAKAGTMISIARTLLFVMVAS